MPVSSVCERDRTNRCDDERDHRSGSSDRLEQRRRHLDAFVAQLVHHSRNHSGRAEMTDDPAALLAAPAEREQLLHLRRGPSSPVISATDSIRRTPSSYRRTCTSRWIADTICSAPPGTAAPFPPSAPWFRAATARRWSSSRIVPMPPSCPVFMACSMSSASAPRTSPTMMRSGRMRSALISRSRARMRRVLDVHGPRFHAHDVLLIEGQLGGVLDRDDPLGVGNRLGQDAEQRRFASARSARDQDVLSRERRSREIRGSPATACPSQQVVAPRRRRPKRRMEIVGRRS